MLASKQPANRLLAPPNMARLIFQETFSKKKQAYNASLSNGRNSFDNYLLKNSYLQSESPSSTKPLHSFHHKDMRHLLSSNILLARLFQEECRKKVLEDHGK